MRTLTAFALLAAALLAGCKKKTESSAPSPDVALSDKDRLQGSWSIESLEDGRSENLRGEQKKEMLDELQSVRIRFEGDKMIIAERGDDEPSTFVLDESANPKVMKLTHPRGSSRGGSPTTAYAGTKRAGTGSYTTGRSTPTSAPAKREPETAEWIYKFEGDTLVLAFSKDNEKERPTEFKARATEFAPDKPRVPGITVVTLKKNDTPPPPNTPRRYTTTAYSRGTFKGGTFKGATSK